MMAFEKGGLVPGVGNGDTVPAMLTPGEHVSDKKLTQGLQHMVDVGGPRGNSYTVHMHVKMNASALDADGVS